MRKLYSPWGPFSLNNICLEIIDMGHDNFLINFEKIKLLIEFLLDLKYISKLSRLVWMLNSIIGITFPLMKTPTTEEQIDETKSVESRTQTYFRYLR